MNARRHYGKHHDDKNITQRRMNRCRPGHQICCSLGLEYVDISDIFPCDVKETFRLPSFFIHMGYALLQEQDPTAAICPVLARDPLRIPIISLRHLES